jgi:hypothetical protein
MVVDLIMRPNREYRVGVVLEEGWKKGCFQKEKKKEKKGKN